MSQAIRKYQTGGKSSQEPELFEWKDVNKYNKSDLVSGLYRNIDTYIQNNGLKGDKADQFRKAAGQFIEGLKSGTVTMNGDGTFTDASGQMSSTGKYDKKFLGLGTKNTENNAFNRVGDYALSYIKGMSPYKAQVEEKPQTKAAPISFKQRLANIAMGGNWDDSLWRKFNSQDRLGFLRQAIQSSHNDFINNPEAEYNKDVFGTRENWIERSSNLLKALEDNKYDPEDLKFSAAMGYGDLGTYLNDEVQQQPTQGLQRPEGIDDDEWAKMQEAYKVRQARDKEARMQSYEDVINPKPTDEEIYEEQRRKFIDLGDSNLSKYNKIDVLPEVRPYDFDAAFESRAGDANSPWDLKHFFASYNTNPNAVVDGSIIKDVYNKNVRHINDVLYYVPDTTNAQNLSNNLDYWIREQERRGQEVERLPSGEYVIPHTYDAATGLIRVYDRNKRTLRYIQAHSTKTGRGLFESNYNESNKDKYAKWSKADGGVIKAQQGASLGYDSKAERAAVHEWYKQQQQANNAAKVEQAVASGKSPQQATNDSKPHTQWSKADITRMGALMGDVTSLLVSLTGVGSVASAGIGAASTAANQAADMMEGQGFFQSLGNNMGSYALDALSLIPFAKAAKVPKIIKNVSRFAPLMTTALATYQGLSNGGEYINTWNKVKKGESLTVGDWRNILNSMQVVLGGAAATHRASKGKSHVEAAKSADTVWMKTPQGWRKVNSNIAKQVEAATSIDAQNKLLKDTGIRLEEAKSWGGFGKGKGVAKVETTPYYDFSKPVTTYSGDLPLQHTFGPGEKFIGTAQFPDINLQFPNVRNAYNKVVHPKATKRAKAAKAEADAIANKPITEGVDAISNMLNSMVRASRYQSGVAPRRRVNIGTQQYANRVVPVGGTPVQAPDAATVRTVMGINNAVNAVPTKSSVPTKNLPAIIPASRNAEKVVAANTKKPAMGTKELVESRFTKGQLQGAARTNKEKTYKGLFDSADKRYAERVVQSQTKAGKAIQAFIDKQLPSKPRGHAKRAKDLQVAFDTPVTLVPARPVAAEPYISKSKSKTKVAKKPKKTSRDDKVTKKADGGIIPMLQTGNVMKKRNVSSAPNLNWNTDVAGSQGFKNTLGGINTGNARLYNDMQNTYATLGFNDTKPGDVSLPYRPEVASYQGNFDNMTSINDETMSGLVKSGRVTGRGGSSDKGTQWTPDGYAGDQTWLRHLGTNNISADNLAKVRAGVNDNIDVVKNLDTGMLNFMPKAKAAGITSGNPQPAMPTKLESPVPAMGSNPTKKQIRDAKRSQKAAGDGTVRGAAGGEKKGLGGFSVLPEDVIALGRMVGGLATNNKAAEQYKAGLKPLLIDTYENTVPITGNYFAKASADRQASNLTSLAARPRTSDASLQLAGELEAQNKAGDIRFQGDMADADMFYKTRMMAQQESDAAKARRTDVANRNRASMLQIDAAKAQIDSAKTTANYQQVINPYLSGIENQFRQNRAARKQYDAESYRQGLLSTMQPQYDAAVQAGDTAKQQQLLRQYNTDMLNYSRNNVGMPWMFQRTTPSPNAPYTYAKGGRLTAQERIIIQRAKDFNRRMLADNKQFHKDIMAAKKQHADMIKHMSSLTSELIKKGMSWK